MRNFQKLVLYGSIIVSCGQAFSSGGLEMVSHDKLLESYSVGVGDPASDVCRVSEEEKRLVSELLLKWTHFKHSRTTPAEDQLAIFLQIRKLLQGIEGSAPREQILEGLLKVNERSLFLHLVMYAEQQKKRENIDDAHAWDILALLDLLSSHKKEGRLILLGAAWDLVYFIKDQAHRSRVFQKIETIPTEKRLVALKQVLGVLAEKFFLDKSDVKVVLSLFDDAGIN